MCKLICDLLRKKELQNSVDLDELVSACCKLLSRGSKTQSLLNLVQRLVFWHSQCLKNHVVALRDALQSSGSRKDKLLVFESCSSFDNFFAQKVVFPDAESKIFASFARKPAR